MTDLFEFSLKLAWGKEKQFQLIKKVMQARYSSL